MPNNAKVFIHYGPYESCGTVEHRTERLQGLQSKGLNHVHEGNNNVQCINLF